MIHREVLSFIMYAGVSLRLTAVNLRETLCYNEMRAHKLSKK